jgi:hypothetical protein
MYRMAPSVSKNRQGHCGVVSFLEQKKSVQLVLRSPFGVFKEEEVQFTIPMLMNVHSIEEDKMELIIDP